MCSSGFPPPTSCPPLHTSYLSLPGFHSTWFFMFASMSTNILHWHLFSYTRLETCWGQDIYLLSLYSQHLLQHVVHQQLLTICCIVKSMHILFPQIKYTFLRDKEHVILHSVGIDSHLLPKYMLFHSWHALILNAMGE